MNWLRKYPLRIVILMSCVLFGLQSGIAHAERRVALVIGNAEYSRSPDLRNPINDARAMGIRLKQLGFELVGDTHYENITRIEMARLVRRFTSELGKDDTALLFYAGHGIGAYDTNWMVPTDDRDIQTALDLPDFAISVSSVMERLERRKGGTNIVFLDACRDNPLPSDTRSSGSNRGLGRMSAPNGTFVAYAADPGQVAFDGEGNNGLFTEALMQALDDPERPLYEIMRQVRRHVRKKTSGAQTPWTEESLNDEFFFTAPRAEVRVAKVETVQPVSRAPQATQAPKSGWSFTPPAATQAAPQAPRPAPQAQQPAPAPQPAASSSTGSSFGAEPSLSAVQPAPAPAPAPKPEPVRVAVVNPVPQPVQKPKPTLDDILRPMVGDLAKLSPSPFRAMKASGDLVGNVNLPGPFAISRQEVTFAQWDACVASGGCNGYTPDDDGEGRGERPVFNVNWEQAQSFIAWVNKMTGLTGKPGAVRLPSDAEWEYAARGGTNSAFYFGATNDQICGFENVMDAEGVYEFPVFEQRAVRCDDGRVRPAPVANYQPNGFGLYDMLGNVSEWVEDCYVRRQRSVPENGAALTKANCKKHVIRGGSWMQVPTSSGDRGKSARGGEAVGFRVARSLN